MTDNSRAAVHHVPPGLLADPAEAEAERLRRRIPPGFAPASVAAPTTAGVRA